MLDIWDTLLQYLLWPVLKEYKSRGGINGFHVWNVSPHNLFLSLSRRPPQQPQKVPFSRDVEKARMYTNGISAPYQTLTHAPTFTVRWSSSYNFPSRGVVFPFENKRTTFFVLFTPCTPALHSGLVPRMFCFFQALNWDKEVWRRGRGIPCFSRALMKALNDYCRAAGDRRGLKGDRKRGNR